MPRRSKTIALSLLALIVAGCQAEEPPPAPTKRPVKAIVVEPVASAESVTLTGFIAAQIEGNLSFRTSGQIIERTVDIGDRVRKGQVLARIDPKVQQADVEAAQAVASSAAADVEQASAAFARSQSLLQRGFTTRRDFDAADQALKVARANAASAQASLESAEDSLSYAALTAEADGVVTARELDVGEVAQAAATVFTIALDGQRDAVFDIYESLLLGGREPPEITVALVADPSVKVKGRIRQISPTVDQTSGTVRVKIGLESTPDAMTLGAAVVGTAVLPSIEVVVIPASALTSLDGRAAAWVLDPVSGEVVPRPIAISSYQASTVTVRDGLKAGDRVVVEGTKLLRPGEAVVIPKEEAASR
ncbi:acriflavin resistance protein [Aureimonas sp. SA4125]|uniref:efflux RND transporter periplasmic adaptor subunit n=1 Tax=Aureimonas sp. SA4125 TaxID=2826993 RepID=UPI001CC6C107|nr:efflux RND transporter periplasmic adaptor subunit [Aureimonas sp. SA4125]BDA84653.1 acriflavin resistance protein [Aureimonas sp. SA4125]